jgi:hypothetical protein
MESEGVGREMWKNVTFTKETRALTNEREHDVGAGRRGV